jgi:hypothetical protein
MLSRPLPRSLQKKPELPKKKRKRSAIFSLGVLGALGIVGVTVGMLLGAASTVKLERKPRPATAAAARKAIESELDSGNEWFLDEKQSQLPKVKQLLDEADAKGAHPTHYKQKTGLVEINLRQIIEVERPGTDAAKKKPELEAAEALRVAEKPQPVPSDRRGKVFPGGSKARTAKPGEEVPGEEPME